MTRLQAIPGLDASAYARHPLHADERVWLEKNCYIDIWIELLHALRLEPLAMLGPAVALDFVGDQWTFLKPSHAALWSLYGIDVQEMTCWKPLLEHVREQLSAGRLVSSEADAWWLPDTAGTDYRRQHTKSTIVIDAVDFEAGRLGYFHNAGYFSLDGEDFAGLFRVGAPADPAFMPLFAEWVAVDRKHHLSLPKLATRSYAELKTQIARMPADNPVARFAARYLGDAPQMPQHGLARYHAWAFANTRQLGASMELAQCHLDWLAASGMPVSAAAGQAAGRLAATCKTLILKGARSAATGKTQGLAEILAQMTLDAEQFRAALLQSV
jgi:hypothetical protein